MDNNKEIPMDWLDMEDYDAVRMPSAPQKRPSGGLDGVFATGIAWMPYLI